MSTPDRFGDILDADTVEDAFRAQLQAWLPALLAHQERRRSLTQGSLPAPRSWPTVSEFDLKPHDQLPAVVIASPGTTGRTERISRYVYRKVWALEVAIAVAGRNEIEARELASLYLAAIGAIADQAPTLGGVVEQVRWTGPDDHAFGTAPGGGQRAIYGTAFEIKARTVAPSSPLTTPPDDPYQPDPAPPLPDTAVIEVTAVAEDATP